MPAGRSSRIHSLAEAVAGELLEVTQILFEESRRRCAELGLRVGTRARCERRTAEGLELLLHDGQRVAIDNVLAAFVEVGVPDAAEAPADAGSSLVFPS